ncbi:MAG: FAD-dependent oxidoreductase [Thermoproteota archaeon]
MCGERKVLLTPIKVGRYVSKNRLEAAPAFPMLASSDGDVTPFLMEWYKVLASSGVGIVTIGSSPVSSKVARLVGHVLDLGTDRVVNALERLAEVIKSFGALASIEISYHGPSVPKSPQELTKKEIVDLIKKHAQAVYRCVVAGMNMIMLHAGHGHLLAQFLSPVKNKRNDEYGGNLENRTRLLREILEAIRNRVGDTVSIELRISGEEGLEAGVTGSETAEICKMLEPYIDLLHVSGGNLYDETAIPRVFPPCYMERAPNLGTAAMLKKILNIPVSVVGGFNLELAEEAVSRGLVDIVAFARALMADTDMLRKWQQGLPIRPCIRCNTCIHRAHTALLTVHCAVNPSMGRQLDLYFSRVQPPPRKKRVVIVGGGPAGMESARYLSDKGHKVYLFEKEPELGGNLKLASSLSFKTDLKNYLLWAVEDLRYRNDVELNLCEECTPDSVLKIKPDAIIIAVGADPVLPEIPMHGNPKYKWVGDVLMEMAGIGHDVLILGAGLVGSELALELAMQGKEVVLMDKLGLEEVDAELPFPNILYLRWLLKKHGVKTFDKAKVKYLDQKEVHIEDKEGNQISLRYDTLIFSTGMKPRRHLVDLFSSLAPESYAIGDCKHEKGNLYKAIADAFWVGLFI